MGKTRVDERRKRAIGQDGEDGRGAGRRSSSEREESVLKAKSREHDKIMAF